MAVSKRVRFEVLRRDNHTCQYCGAKAPDVVLHVDHVMPVSLGGDDKPNNLVVACRDCNAGKTSIVPGSPLVEAVGEKAAAYALGMLDKMTRLRASIEAGDEFLAEFEELWNNWTFVGTDKRVPLPPDYEMSVHKWFSMGVPMRLIGMAIAKAMGHPNLRLGDYPVFSYMSGIIHRKLDEHEVDLTLTEERAAVYTERDMDNERVAAYQNGVERGTEKAWMDAIKYMNRMDLVAAHIDGRLSVAGVR